MGRPRIAVCAGALVTLVVATSLLPSTWAQEAPKDGATNNDATKDGATKDGASQTGVDDILSLADKPLEALSRERVVSPSLGAEVSTVSRQQSTVGKSPAAVFVITNEMIRRSGARSLAEVLRMAPGVNVARLDSNKPFVSIRGFNEHFTNKLLVQIDGRCVYTPEFGGVYWDVQDVLLEDVDRIEVIRGPGGTVWGANAVNGVINILTKSADKTQGAFAEAGGGTEERGFASARVGGQYGSDTYWRVYGKWFVRDGGDPLPSGANDDWNQQRGGFRIDWRPTECDHATLQGDVYDGRSRSRERVALLAPPFSIVADQDDVVRGGNVLYRFTHTIDERQDWRCQLYYDRTERAAKVTAVGEHRDTIDVDFQYRFPLAEWHDVICGAGYRNTKDLSRGDVGVQFIPSKRADDLFSYFAQDQMTLYEDLLYFTVGSKFEHNDYTSFEFQPSARILWTPTPRQSIWAAISRAVRTPARSNTGINVLTPPITTFPSPLHLRILGNRGLESEDLLAYEIGMRAQPTERFYWDLAVFFNDYNGLTMPVSGAPLPGPPRFIPLTFQNATDGVSYGYEIAANYEMTRCWKLHGSYSFLRIELEPAANVSLLGASAEGNSPVNQLFLRSAWDLGCDWELDVMWRYVDHLTVAAAPAYNVMDVRLAWQATRNLEMAVVGRHLLAGSHPEFRTGQGGDFPTDVEQEVYGSLTWRF